jgi:hypothetical protein
MPCPAVATASAPDPFVAGFDADGQGLWVRVLGATEATTTLDDLSVSGDALWAAGSYDGDVDFGGPTLTMSATDLYLAAFSSDGTPLTQVAF